MDEAEISEEDDEENDGLEDLIDDKDKTPPHIARGVFAKLENNSQAS